MTQINGFKVLVVNPDSKIRGELAHYMATGFNLAPGSVDIAENGEEGTRKAGSTRLILAANAMPEMDGLTMIQRIRTNDAITEQPYIILITGGDAAVAAAARGPRTICIPAATPNLLRGYVGGLLQQSSSRTTPYNGNMAATELIP